jgi:predicted CxxxxCH...CXXCH cytochrome family protein
MKETDVSHQIPSLCTTCHKDSISACNTCHGNGNNPAPPDALDGSVSKSYIGVGAHQIHVAENEFTDAFKCHDCHEQPCAGHYDTAPPAEVCFSAIAKSGIWDRTSMRCSNILCHGDSLGGTKLSNLAWNTVNTAAIKCGDCHSLPPEKTLSGDFHPALKECVQCHSDVVDSKQRIISKEKHIRGL